MRLATGIAKVEININVRTAIEGKHVLILAYCKLLVAYNAIS